MVMSKEQTQRLMELLNKLVDRDAGNVVQDNVASYLRMPEFNGPEHNDAKTLVYMGWIKHRRMYTDVTNTWSGQGIYDFELTDDGKKVLEEWNNQMDSNTEGTDTSQSANRKTYICLLYTSPSPRDS